MGHAVLLAVALFAATAEASTFSIIPGAPLGGGPSQILTPGDTFVDRETFLPFTQIALQYNAEVLFGTPLNVVTTVAPNNGNFFGILNLQFTWFDVADGTVTTLTVTDASGHPLDTSLSLVLPGGFTYRLAVRGTASFQDNDGYFLTISPVLTPLPSTLALFGSVLLGSALLATRRRKPTGSMPALPRAILDWAN